MFILFLFNLAFAQESTTITSHATVTATTSSAVAAALNADRNYLLIQNKGSVDVFCKAGSSQTGTEGVKIIPSGNWEPFIAPRQAVYCVTGSSTADLSVVQGVKP